MVRDKKPLQGMNSTAAAPEPEKAAPDHTASVDASPCLVVGIGASAGGQEALEQLFTSMPANCGLAFVVIMHLHPDGPSYLPEILGRCTPMPVVTAEDGMTLRPDAVHVIPPGVNLTIAERHIRLESAERTRRAHHPIDHFFKSLAAEAKGRSVAVVLSGFGIDGSAGIKAVKDAGGAVLVQEPASAVNHAMPKSAIATGAAHFILPAEEIAPKIAEIARGNCVLPHNSCRVATLDDELGAIFRVVKSKTGHDFSSYKANTVMRRIERRMAINEVSGIGKYVALIEENPQEAQALCQDILIGVTSFFRDPEAFEILRHEVIPRLFDGRDPEDPVRIWHACCATGEEVYSMAILIQEHLSEHGLNAKVQLFATDIDETAIAQARAGIYPDDIEHDLGRERLEKFFNRIDGRWQVKKQIREMVVFAHHSLIKDPPFSRLDLLVCRNFLIYLNPDMQKRLITLFHQVLKSGAVLFLGSAETVGRNSELFATIDNKWKIFERLESKRRMETVFPLATSVRMPTLHRRARPAEAEEPSPGIAAERLLMERYSPPCVVVSDKFETVHVSTRLSRFLEVPTGEPTRDILRMAREDLRPTLRAAIYKSFAEQKRIEFRGVKVADEGYESTVNLIVEPLGPTPGSKLAMVVFEPCSTPAQTAGPSGEGETLHGKSSKETLIRQLEEQLRVTHEQLQATSEQLETSNEGFMSANEELMSINEEFQSANEELQSTNEELETSKEELQALNEELITVNAELQGKVEELNQATSDMENLLSSSGVATLFLDRELHIKGFTPAVAEIFNLIQSDIGRPFRHLAGKIDWPTLTQDAETVLAGQPFAEREVTSLDRERCYLKRIFPYRTQGGTIDGVVVIFIDITERKRMEERTVHLASFPQLNPNPIVEVDSAGRIIFANPATGKILDSLGMDAADVNVFLPADLDRILREWDRKSEATLHREITVGNKTFGESIFLTPLFDVARIYAFDITERKHAQEALAESEQRIRHKLDSIIAPEGDIGNLDLADIIDAQSLQALVDDFYELTGMPMGLIDLKGRVLVGVGWQAICTQFHRVNPETCKNCIESDTLLSAGVPHGEYKVYKCRNNMWDVATPVMVGDRQFGNLFMGQFFFDDEPIDYELFRSQAKEYGFDEKEYIAALEAVPRLSRETLNISMAFFMKLADILSKLSYSNLKLARSLAERDSLMESLHESGQQNEFLAHILEVASQPLSVGYPDGRLGLFNHAFEELTGYTGDELRSIDWDRTLTPPEWRKIEHEKLEELRRTGRPVRYEKEYIRKDGSRVPIELLVHIDADADGKPLYYYAFVTDISERKWAEEEIRRRVEELRASNVEREHTIEFLRLVNECSSTRGLIEAATGFFREKSGCEAIGIRLRDDDDYPYFETHGFPREFVQLENSLCCRDRDGEVVRDSEGNPVIDCMCGNVICGRFDPAKPFFTIHGSFWSNGTTELLASTSEADRQVRTRNRCNGEGYESVALIPLCLGEERLGLLQLNDRQKGRFTPELIALWERLADYLAVALAKFRTDEALRQSEERYHTLFNSLIEGFCIIDVLFDADDHPVDYRFLEVNPAFEVQTGLRNAEGKLMRELAPDHEAHWFEIYGKVALTGEPVRFENEAKALNRWYEVSAYRIGGEDSRKVAIVFNDITEAKRAEEDLRRSKEEWERTFNSVPDLIAIIDDRHRVGRVNRAMAERLGREPEECVGMPCYEAVHGANLPPDFCPHSKTMRDGGEHNVELHEERLGGDYLVTTTPLLDSQGRMTGTVHVARDITESKRAEESLRRAHDELEIRVGERTQELADTVEILLEQISERERMEASLLRLNRLYAVLGEIAQSIIRVNDRNALFHDFCRIAVEQGGFLLSWVGLVDEESGQVRVMAACGATGYLDAIRISADEGPIGEGPTGISIRQGTYHICNDFQNDPCTQPWHDRGRTYGIQASASVAIKEDGRVVGALTLYANEKDFFDRQQVELLVQMGADVSFALDNLTREARRQKTEKALQEETLERLTVVEALREKEQMLIQQSRNAAMGEMINNIAHQWRQPLNTLGLMIQQLPLLHDLGKIDRELLDHTVGRSMGLIQYMSKTIDDFRNYFKPDKEMIEFQVIEAVENTVTLLEGSLQSPKVSIEIDAKSRPVIKGYRNEFAQVLLNILINARDAMIERKISDPRVTVTIFSEDHTVVVTVADNAGGISEEIIGKVFDPYFTTKGPQQGTGVGLFMSKTIIEKNMGGRLSVHNRADGAEFRIEVGNGNAI